MKVKNKKKGGKGGKENKDPITEEERRRDRVSCHVSRTADPVESRRMKTNP